MKDEDENPFERSKDSRSPAKERGIHKRNSSNAQKATARQSVMAEVAHNLKRSSSNTKKPDLGLE